jgi:hypothetical protein
MLKAVLLPRYASSATHHQRRVEMMKDTPEGQTNFCADCNALSKENAALRAERDALQARIAESEKQPPTVYMASDHVGKFVHQACGSDSMFARCSYRQLHADYVPLYTHSFIQPAGMMRDFTDAELTAIYNKANGIGGGKNPPISTKFIFAAMRAMVSASPVKEIRESDIDQATTQPQTSLR